MSIERIYELIHVVRNVHTDVIIYLKVCFYVGVLVKGQNNSKGNLTSQNTCACSYAMSSLVTPAVINYCINTNPDLFPDTAPRYMDDTGVKTKTPELNLHRPVREISGP